MSFLHASDWSTGDVNGPGFTSLDALLRESGAAMEAAESQAGE